MLARLIHVVQVLHDPHGAEDDEAHDQHSEGEGENVVGIVGSRRDVQEEDEVDAHLRDREYQDGDGDARSVDRARTGCPERGGGEAHCERQAEDVSGNFPLQGAAGTRASGEAILADMRAGVVIVVHAHGSICGGRVPTR